jgi:hypothetical protein
LDRRIVKKKNEILIRWSNFPESMPLGKIIHKFGSNFLMLSLGGSFKFGDGVLTLNEKVAIEEQFGRIRSRREH